MYLLRRLEVVCCACLVALISIFLFSANTFADIGVGVGAGKITLQKSLEPGGGYELPLLPVLNTGNEPGEYGISVEFNERQPELKPSADWFRFSPVAFHLEPQQSQMVRTTLVVPVTAKPGNYFVYLEAHPVKADISGQTSVGIAAAAKLYFTVAPSNLLQAAYYRSLALIAPYAPWTYIIAGVIALAACISLLRRIFSFNVGISFKKK